MNDNVEKEILQPLKPCPFCGGGCWVNKDQYKPGVGYLYSIHCPTCHYSFDGFKLNTEEKAINAWNKRSPATEKKWPNKKDETIYEGIVFSKGWNSCHDAFMKVINGNIESKEFSGYSTETPHLKGDFSDPIIGGHFEETETKELTKEKLLEILTRRVNKPTQYGDKWFPRTNEEIVDELYALMARTATVPLDGVEIGNWINSYTWNHPLIDKEGKKWNIITHREGMDLGLKIARHFSLPPRNVTVEEIKKVIYGYRRDNDFEISNHEFDGLAEAIHKMLTER